MNLSRSIASNTLIQVVGRVVAGVVTVGILSMVLHAFGASMQGKYILALTYAQFVGTIADFGLNSYLVRIFSLVNKDTQTRHVVSFRVVISSVFFLIGGLIVFFLPYDPETRHAIWIALISTFLLSINSVFVAFYQANLEMKIPVFGDILNRVVTITCTIVAIHFWSSFMLSLAAMLVGALFNISFLAFLLRGRLDVARKIDTSQWRTILIATFPIWITTIFSLIYFRIDSILLSVLPLPAGHTNFTELANYGTAYKFLEILIAAPGMLLSTLIPALARAENDRVHFSSLVRYSIYLISLFAAPVTIGTFLVSGQLIETFFSTLTSAADALRILIWAFVFSALAAAFMYSIIAAGQQRRLLWPNIGISVVNVCLNFIFIPRYGFYGAAWTTVLSEFFVFIAGWYIVVRGAKLVDQPFDKRLVGIWLAALGMGAIVWLMPFGLISRVVIGIVSYIALLFLMNAFDHKLFGKLRETA